MKVDIPRTRELAILKPFEEGALVDLARLSPIFEEISKTQKRALEIVAPMNNALKNFQQTYGGILKTALEARDKYLEDFNRHKSMFQREDRIIPVYRPYPLVRLHPDDQEEIADMVMARIKPLPVHVQSYQLPKNVDVSKLKIKFINGHTVKIKYPGMPIKTFDYKQMGFENHKSSNPDDKWDFLLKISESGFLTNYKFDRKLNRKVKYTVSERLKKFLGVDCDVFYGYTKKDGYRTVFRLIPEQSLESLTDEEVL